MACKIEDPSLYVSHLNMSLPNQPFILIDKVNIRFPCYQVQKHHIITACSFSHNFSPAVASGTASGFSSSSNPPGADSGGGGGSSGGASRTGSAVTGQSRPGAPTPGHSEAGAERGSCRAGGTGLTRPPAIPKTGPA